MHWLVLALLATAAVSRAAPSEADLRDYALGKETPSLKSSNRYARVRAIELLRDAPQTISAVQAQTLAALLFDTTQIVSTRCLECESTCRSCDGCWGSHGHSGCDARLTVGDIARQAVAAVSPGPFGPALANEIWSIARRSEASARQAAESMPFMHAHLASHLEAALRSADAALALRLVVAGLPASCDEVSIDAIAEIFDNLDSRVQFRSAVVLLACSESHRAKAVGVITRGLRDPSNDLLSELPALPGVIGPLKAAIGARMQTKAVDAAWGAKLLTASPTLSREALAGTRARLRVCEIGECHVLLTLIVDEGRRAATLAPAVFELAMREPECVAHSVETLQALRASLTTAQRASLEAHYQRSCGPGDECMPFNRVFPRR